MTRLYVVSEGLTEVTFVRDVLTPHLERQWPERLTVHSPNLGGHRSYAGVKKLIRTLFAKPGSEVLVTTMLDVFNLAADFPGRTACDGYDDPWKRVEELEKFFYQDIQDRRLIPYLQLHEFEALILTDARCLAKYYPNRKGDLLKLAKSVDKKFKSPEEVNRGTPPSWRIKTAVPEYEKPLFGISAFTDLGMKKVRAACKHFDSWLKKLEGLF